ncbi:hypothetical protein ACAG26_24055 [Mycobacterium sp. pUA109]|uniref:hypothetical protein n=1 Tax=Mycobacterium sp. pUA109 TaxID=3238982 RepID=UPI00351B96A9
MSTVRTVYVGDRATHRQVAAAVEAWQGATGEVIEYDIDDDGDLYAGMGFAIDVFAGDYDAQLATAYRLANGIRPLLAGVPVAVDRDLQAQKIAATPERR